MMTITKWGLVSFSALSFLCLLLVALPSLQQGENKNFGLITNKETINHRQLQSKTYSSWNIISNIRVHYRAIKSNREYPTDNEKQKQESTRHTFHERFRRSTEENGKEDIENIFKLLKEGETEIVLSKERNIIVLLGNTGAGSSTFAQFIAGDNDKLISVENGEDTGEFIFVDNKRIGDEKIKSKTIFPELVVDLLTNTHFYDCPGFSDTRSTSSDIAASYFTKKVIDHAHSVKLFFIVNYSSVRYGVDLQDFMTLMRHVCNLVTDVKKFKDSIALVVTKVDNAYTNIKGNLTLVSDDKVIKNIAKFLTSVKESMQRDMQTEKISFHLKAIQFIDILLVMIDNKFTKICLFRRPDESGPVSKINLLQNSKRQINNLLSNEISFTSKLNTDFGFTISERSKNDISELVKYINKEVTTLSIGIGQEIIGYYRAQTKLENISSNTLYNMTEAGLIVFSQINSEVNKLKDPKDYVHKLNQTSFLLDIVIPDKLFLDMVTQSEYFDFLQTVDNRDLKITPFEWVKPIIDVVDYLKVLKSEVLKQSEDEINQVMTSCTKSISNNIILFYKNSTENVHVSDLISSIEHVTEGFTKFSRFSSKVADLKKPKDFIDQIKNSLNKQINIQQDCVLNMIKQSEYFDFLQSVTDRELKITLFEWIKPINEIVDFLRNLKVKELKKFENKINNNTKSCVIEIVNPIIASYLTKTEQTKDFVTLKEHITEGLTFYSQIISDVSKFKKVQDFVNKIKQIIFPIQINIPLFCLFNVVKESDNFEFSELLNREELKLTPSEWVKPIDEVVYYLTELNNWLKWLLDLYNKLSEYDIQENTSKYNVKNITDWGTTGKTQGIKISRANFESFLVIISKLYRIENVNVEGVNDMKLQSLNVVLDSTLKPTTNISCSKEGTLVVKGEFLKLSQISSQRCPHKINTIEIYATNTIFIDENLVREDDQFKLVILSPKWFIHNIRHINLSGRNGERHSQAKNDISLDGKHGLPGETGGSFLGIGKYFINGNDLTITANGGVGGPGQIGGDGADGENGTDAYIPEETLKKTYSLWGNETYDAINNGEFKIKFLREEKVNSCKSLTTCWNYYYEMYGKSGQIGGNGGNGGKGGMGGNKGNIQIIKLNQRSNIHVIMNDGMRGEGGDGGKGGLGGFNGNDIYVLIRGAYLVAIFIPASLGNELFIKKTTIIAERVWSGMHGISNSSVKDILLPKKAISTQAFFLSIVNFKYHIIEQLVDDFRNHRLTEFYLQFVKNPLIVNFSRTTLVLVHELRGLEDKFHQFRKKIHFLPFYESLLARIHDYSKHVLESETSLEHKRILSYLYTATLSKVCTLKAANERNLIIDISKFLKQATSVKKLKDIKYAIGKNEIKSNYKSKIDIKIKEANVFINDIVSPEIDNINNQLDQQLELLLNETIYLQEQAKTEKEELIKKRKELEDAAVLNLLFGIFKAVGQVVSLLGPVGQVISGVMEQTSMVGETLRGTDNFEPMPFILPPGIRNQLQNSEDILSNVIQKKRVVFIQQLDVLTVDVSNYSDQLNLTKTSITRIRTKLTKLLPGDEITPLEEELNIELAKNKNNLESEVNKNSKSSYALKVIDTYNKGTKIAKISVDLYRKINNDKKKIEAINQAIDESQNKIDQLKQYETSIHNIMTPVLKNMMNGLNDIKSKLGSKSHVALDVTKWQVQRALKDIKHKMQQFTQGFKVQENFLRCFEKLDEALTIMVNLYDRIESYQDQKSLADYIADLSSADSERIVVTDTDLKNATQDLDLIIQTNIVLGEYERAVNAFKQWVFPFAHLYLEEFSLPSYLKLGNDIESLTSVAVTQIEQLRNKVNDYKSSVIKGHDEYILTSTFNSEYVSTKPFFAWRNKNHKSLISHILSGNNVALKADVINDYSSKNAIKFNAIEIRITSANNTIQNNVNNILKHFQVSLTHLGNSYYKCGNLFYVITSESQTIKYSFDKDTHGKHVTENNVYSKIKNGDLMLSPYAMWQLQLFTETSGKFKDLEMYKDDVDIELVGRGQYVSDDTNVCNSMLKNYYIMDASLSSF